ncbi:MAG TPA: hypothetical protein VGR81_08115 [Candidatus Acidoferrales bacterium]|nr:hypothetical protein [Candidatus Acidoferrales bacterium]
MQNPFRPGAGHMPPYLAGRQKESEEFNRLLEQDIILKNLVLTGLRGLGKTVLLETFKPMAIRSGWLWAGTDLSESTSISEENLATRLLTDLSVVASSFVISKKERPKVGFGNQPDDVAVALNYPALRAMYESIPGLVLDKLKGVLETVWPYVEASGRRGIIFAYDEAQNLTDHAKKDQYPLSLLLDLFQSLQRKNYRFMLALVGLPTLFPKLVEARTFSERMFTVIFLSPLNEKETAEAVKEPIQRAKDCPINFDQKSVRTIWKVARGYPYFVQYVCREVFDIWVQAIEGGKEPPLIPVAEIIAKLDSDFFAGRWARATDRQRQLLGVIAELPNADAEFTVQEIVESVGNKETKRSFSSSHVNQMLVSLSESGLIYKNRYSKYSFAVPLLGDFIKRQKLQVLSA